MIPKIFLLAALASSFAFWAGKHQEAIDARQHAATEWSSENSQFVATGIDNETLEVFLPQADSVSCDAYVDYIATNKDIRWLFKGKGFKNVKCLDRVLVLSQ